MGKNDFRANCCFETNSDMVLQNEKEVVVSTTRLKDFPLLENGASHSDGTVFLLASEFLTKIKPHSGPHYCKRWRHFKGLVWVAASFLFIRSPQLKPFETVVDIC